MQNQINDIEIRIDKMENRIDRIEVFEETYGKKIDAIFDCVTIQLQRNQKQSEEIQELTRRIDKNEIIDC